MNPKKNLRRQIQGWLPKEPTLSYADKTSKSHWKPYWKTFSIVVLVILLAGITFVGMRIYVRYSNPKNDITASCFEKTVNGTIVNVGDAVELSVRVYWHGYVLPEFKREIKIVDAFPESHFALVSGTNAYEGAGYGGSYQLKYTLIAIEGGDASVELPKPRLSIDNIEIPLDGTGIALKISAK